MEEHIVKILEADYINYNVKRFIVEKPKNYSFIPGQATMVSINLDGWRDREAPFTFTSINEWPFLQFIIKIYNDHDGITKELGKLNSGNELIIRDPWGTIQYKKPGVFLAGGAGITPFIAIFRELYKEQALSGNQLYFSNKTADDIFLYEELTRLLGDNYHNVLTRENVVGFMENKIDRRFLIENIRNFGQDFYVCGPPSFVHDVSEALISLGANLETITFEKE
ncbi:FAD-binding oxidoreductase [Solitalea koreensis]|uniref:FAD-binding FR-type domain-containing protein n=1 Tax=Solitalea koreensis TaxID=543615 RepID=A0A521BH73_9SPHI|nr:FAD-binding oxidoreductase [Solitalea koreensis]SMO46379.1 hypothetical protein SAMN06265350_102197 [Solitalea koreensis]